MTSPYYDAFTAKEATPGGPGNRGVPIYPADPHRPRVRFGVLENRSPDIKLTLYPYLVVSVTDGELEILRDQIDAALLAKREYEKGYAEGQAALAAIREQSRLDDIAIEAEWKRIRGK